MSYTVQSWRRRAAAFLVLLALGIGGCASGGATGGERRNPDRISGEELARARSEGIADMEQLIQRLRPRWLERDRIRSFNLESAILVYDNNAMLGGVDVLNSLTLDLVREVRWLRSAEAGTLPGAGSLHVEGAIVIVRN